MPATILTPAVMTRDFPELVWASNTTLNIVGKRGNGASVYLSDGSLKSNASDTNGWVLSTNLDTGSIANSTWYYLYAVSNGDQFSVKASVTKPTYVGGAGPTGYAAHKYLGSVRTDASGNILRFFKDRGFYQYSPGAFDVLNASNNLSIYTNPGTTQNWTIALNGLTKYPLTSQLVRVGTGGARTNGDVMTFSFQEQISGVYYNRATFGATTYTSTGGSYFPGGFYECDLVNGVWQLVGACSSASAITSAIWVDGIREPANWFQI